MRGMDIVRIVGVAVLVIWAQPAQATDAQKIGVMDQQAVMERSKAGKSALDEFKQYSATREKIIDADAQELKDLERTLQESLSKLSEADKQEKQEQFRGKVEAYQRRLQDFNREVQQKQRDMVGEYSKRIGEAAQIVAQKEGYVAIFDKGNEALLRIVLYHHPGLDVTDLVVKEFDRQNK
ncbi:MAG: OmpH family outer membrane protein [Nitrospira sp.]|nr:OmpH family outer membrane protein [Nitrospira sp.]MBH0181282.1 OmpH family outer membrane protein [Nitrospira sp.]MBH0185671.1 OmpH family outer membrane protein [Nitrospira sp.]